MPKNRGTSIRNVCLYLGSFNPIHIGHTALSYYALEHLGFAELWYLPSPQSPHKSAEGYLPYELRCSLIREASIADPRIQVVELEHSLPTPHYTIRSLVALQLLHPYARLSLLIGGDNLHSLPRWHAYSRLMELVDIYVYPRPREPLILPQELQTYEQRIHLCHDAPLVDISSSQIRALALEGVDASQYIPTPHRWHEVVSQLKQKKRSNTR